MTGDDLTAAIAGQKALVSNARRLGLTWSIRRASVASPTEVILDGDEDATEIEATFLTGTQTIGTRVTCLLIPPGAVFVIGVNDAGPFPGGKVAKLRQTADQSWVSGAATFVDFGSAEYDPFGGWGASTNPSRWNVPVDGWYHLCARIVYDVNSTSRRSVFINKNGTTSGIDTLAGTSVQAPANGTAQVSCAQDAYLVVGDYIGVRGIQNAGVNLTILAGTDGGAQLDVSFLGPDLT